MYRCARIMVLLSVSATLAVVAGCAPSDGGQEIATGSVRLVFRLPAGDSGSAAGAREIPWEGADHGYVHSALVQLRRAGDLVATREAEFSAREVTVVFEDVLAGAGYWIHAVLRDGTGEYAGHWGDSANFTVVAGDVTDVSVRMVDDFEKNPTLDHPQYGGFDDLGPNEANPLLVMNGDPQRHSFEARTTEEVWDTDWARVELEAGQRVTIEAYEVGGGTEIQMWLYDSAGTELAWSADPPGPGARIEYTAATAGNYYVKLWSANEASQGWYLLRATSGEPGRGGVNVTLE